MNRIAIMASGTGTNAVELLRTAQNLTNVVIPLVIVDQADTPLLSLIPKEFPKTEIKLLLAPEPAVAKASGLSVREAHETLILNELKQYSVQWIFLAGYMRLLTKKFIDRFKKNPTSMNSRVINIHPSLLPKFPGLEAYKQAYNAKEKHTGVTLHFVDEGLDTGQVIAQESFEILSDYSLNDVTNHGKTLEHKMYRKLLLGLNETNLILPLSKKEYQ